MHVMKIQEVIGEYQSISLAEMDKVELMNRRDTKYCVPVSSLPHILSSIMEEYRVLEIDDQRFFPYETAYFDTMDFGLFHLHVNGKLNRHKVRYRRYVSTNTGFYEVKLKTNQGRTIKQRIKQEPVGFLEPGVKKFIEKTTPLLAQQLHFALDNRFHRLTLVNNNLTERVTIDCNLAFSNKLGSEQILKNLGIIEIKQEGYSSSTALVNLLREMGYRPTGISKYCIGAALLMPELKTNALKSKLLTIQKIENNDRDLVA